MVTPGRSFSAGTQYRYGFNGKEKSTEIGEGLTTAEFWEYDGRIGRRWNVDPRTKAAPGWTPYRSFFNNPIYWTDPSGALEYKNSDAYAKANKGKTWDKDRGNGDWLKSDRESNTDIWKNANSFNLQQEKGFKEYTNIAQRASFYSWFQEDSRAKGFETQWAGAASSVAFAINELANPSIMGIGVTWIAKQLNYTSDAAIDFSNTGNRMIFEDVFPKLKTLANGPALKGQDAKNWDAMGLAQEQTLIQPLYQTTKGFGQVGAAATHDLAFSKQLAWLKNINIAPFPKNGNMLDISQRWTYGMQGMGYNSVTPSQMPSPGAMYSSGAMYLRFRGVVDSKFWNEQKK